MSKHIAPDHTLLKMPSLRAIRSFVAAARYQNFTRAAEALCVTQAAISRQVRELEQSLGTPLFKRVGSAVELTAAGSIFFDSAQLSFINIAQAAERIRSGTATTARRSLTLCCSPAFSALWMSHRLALFLSANPNIDINLVTTQNFLSMEPGVSPDIYITKQPRIKDHYLSTPLFHDVIYPVCTPQYLEEHPDISTLKGLKDRATLLNLSPYGRSQVAEHIDWGVWMAIHHHDVGLTLNEGSRYFNANDYNMLIQMALNHQGVALGWDHLVTPLLEDGRLVKPVVEQVVLEEARHYLCYREDKADNEEIKRFRDWLTAECAMRTVPSH